MSFGVQRADGINCQVFGIVQASIKSTARSRDFEVLVVQPNENTAELVARVRFSLVVQYATRNKKKVTVCAKNE